MSVTAVLIMTIALLVVSFLLLTQTLLSSTLGAIKDKVDINLYFVTSADEGDIKSLTKQVETLPEVSSVKYSSREEELAKFKARRKRERALN